MKEHGHLIPCVISLTDFQYCTIRIHGLSRSLGGGCVMFLRNTGKDAHKINIEEYSRNQSSRHILSYELIGLPNPYHFHNPHDMLGGWRLIHNTVFMVIIVKFHVEHI